MELEKYLREKMRSLGSETYQRFLSSELAYHWRELVDKDISDKMTPVKLERGILFVAIESSAYKDQLKFLKADIIDAINEKFGEKIVSSICPASPLQIDKMPPDKNSRAVVEKPKLTPEDMILSEEEIQRCEERAQKVSNEKLRETVLQTLLSQAKVQKFRQASGWHKCLKCDVLCPPEEIFCEVCKIKEREAMVNALFKILYDEPYLKAWDAQKILLNEMPHMKSECTLAAIESARSSLIQKVASKVRYGDEESPDVIKLVALAKRLPPDKLTPAIIRRALIDLQFNLSEQPKLQRYFLKAQKQA